MPIGETYLLEKDEELRIEVDLLNEQEVIYVELLSGIAEIFGTEMVINPGKSVRYKFNHGAKFSVYTYHGCSLTVYGQNQKTPYKSKNHPMIEHINVHSALEDMRSQADKLDNGQGPTVMVVGPQDSGKTTVCKLLVNYAVRQNRSPVFVDLDVEQNSLCIPGSIAATLVERPASIEEGFSKKFPLVYSHGNARDDDGLANPLENSSLYKVLVSNMARAIKQRFEKDDNEANNRAKKAGVIINTYGSVREEGYNQLKHIAEEFAVDVILVLGHERTYNSLARDMKENGKDVKVIWLPKSNGVVDRDREPRQEGARKSIKEYFYGLQVDKNKFELFPHRFDIKFHELKDKVFKIGAPQLPDSCMPIGYKADDSQTKAVAVSLTPEKLQNHVLAVTYAKDKDKLLETNVAGFIVVTEVNMKESKISVLSPQDKPLPKDTLLLLSDIKYIDDT